MHKVFKKRISIKRKLFLQIQRSRLLKFYTLLPSELKHSTYFRRVKKLKRSRRYGRKKFERRARQFNRFLRFFTYRHLYIPQFKKRLHFNNQVPKSFYSKLLTRSSFRLFPKFYYFLYSNFLYTQRYKIQRFSNLVYGHSVLANNKKHVTSVRRFAYKRIFFFKRRKITYLRKFNYRAKKFFIKKFYRRLNFFRFKRSKLPKIRARRKKIKRIKNIKHFKTRAQFHTARLARLTKYGASFTRKFAKTFHNRFAIRIIKTYNNFFIGLQTNRGENVFSYSTGRIDLRRNRRLTKQALEIASRTFSLLIRKKKFRKLSLRIVGRATYHSRVFIRTIRQFGVKLSSINFILRRSHNGLRLRSSRRV